MRSKRKLRQKFEKWRGKQNILKFCFYDLIQKLEKTNNALILTISNCGKCSTIFYKTLAKKRKSCARSSRYLCWLSNVRCHLFCFFFFIFCTFEGLVGNVRLTFLNVGKVLAECGKEQKNVMTPGVSLHVCTIYKKLSLVFALLLNNFVKS